VLSALFQASTKMLAAEMRHTPFSWSWLVQATHSPWAVVVLLSELLSFVLWLNVLTNVPLSKAFPITAVAYIAIELMSWTLFKEPVMPLQIIGSALILTGVWFVGIASDHDQIESNI
jgi:drug/metabolite transporter (DMT)-like permease